MNTDSGHGAPTAAHAQLAGAYWLSSAAHEGDDCLWCALMYEADSRAARAASGDGLPSRRGNVPLGL